MAAAAAAAPSTDDDDDAIAVAMAERQELVLRRQLRELHRLVGVQRQLKGADPLEPQGRAKKPDLLDGLAPLLDSLGGIASIGCVEGVVAIMRKATAVDSTRKLLVVVLEKTKDKMPCLAKFVKMQGLAVLSTWLGDASKAARPQAVVQILRLLPRLPVTVNGLKDSGIGKLVNKLTKEKTGGDEDVRTEAASVLDGWKKLAKAKAAAESTAAAPPAKPAAAAAPATTAADATAAATAPAAAAAAAAPAAKEPGDPAASKAESKTATAAAAAAAAAVAKAERADTAAAAAAAAAATEKKSAARSRATAIRDNDMFGDSKKASGGPPAKKVKASIRPDHVRARAERMKATRMVAAGSADPFESTISSSATTGSGSGLTIAISAPSSSTASGGADRRPSPTNGRPKSPVTASSPPSTTGNTPSTTTTTKPAPKRTREGADASPLSAGARASSDGSGSPGSGSGSSGSPLENGGKKKKQKTIDGAAQKTGIKKKRVTWPADEKIANWKYFTKDEKEDIKPSETEEAAGGGGGGGGGGGFKSAMQEEKAAERRAIAARILQQKIDAMKETLPWGSTLERILLPPDCADSCNRGEDSEEVATQSEREKSALEAFFTQQTIPDSPAEPAAAADRREGSAEAPDDATVPVIPIDDDNDGSATATATAQTASGLNNLSAAPASAATAAAPAATQVTTSPLVAISLALSCKTSLTTNNILRTRTQDLSALVTQITNLQSMTSQMQHQPQGGMHSTYDTIYDCCSSTFCIPASTMRSYCIHDVVDP